MTRAGTPGEVRHVVRVERGRYSYDHDAPSWKRVVVKRTRLDDMGERYVGTPEVVREWPKRWARDRATGAWGKVLDGDMLAAYRFVSNMDATT